MAGKPQHTAMSGISALEAAPLNYYCFTMAYLLNFEFFHTDGTERQGQCHRRLPRAVEGGRGRVTSLPAKWAAGITTWIVDGEGFWSRQTFSVNSSSTGH